MKSRHRKDMFVIVAHLPSQTVQFRTTTDRILVQFPLCESKRVIKDIQAVVKFARHVDGHE